MDLHKDPGNGLGINTIVEAQPAEAIFEAVVRKHMIRVVMAPLCVRDDDSA